MKAQLEQIRRAAKEALASFDSAEQLEKARIQYLGKKGELTAILKQMGKLSAEERPVIGQLANEIRKDIEDTIANKSAEIKKAAQEKRLAEETLDVTMPGTLPQIGYKHPLSIVLDEIKDIFMGMGFDIAEGPEVEYDYYNFEALNIPKNHPARDTQDTFYISDNVLLRTQTSPVQVRAMLTRGVPLYVISPGKVFRADEYDATHLPVFHQLEGLVVDKGISMADLRGTLDHLAKAMFGDVKTRMRPHYFPFTEPSGEVDLECFVCHGASVGNPDAPCRTCKSEGWIEWGGCGVVNPRVLAACGVDPDVYSGFAFGMGVDRTVMFRTGAPDLRDFVEGDIRFSRSILGGAR